MTVLTPGAARHWVNGQECGQLNVTDRGLTFGDGVFETLRIAAGRARFLGLHWQRLRLGCERLQIHGVDYAELETHLRAAAATVADGMAKLIVTRGPSHRLGYAPEVVGSPTRILTLYPGVAPWPPTARVVFSAASLGENPQLAGLKHLNRLENVLARAALPADCEEALLCSVQGPVICGTSSNVFIVLAGELCTPLLNRCGVAGIMRRLVLREAAAAGVTVREQLLTRADLQDAAEIFLTNARVGVWPVSKIANQALAVGPVTAALKFRIEALDGSS